MLFNDVRAEFLFKVATEDEAQYERLRQRYNALVNDYNSLLGTARALAAVPPPPVLRWLGLHCTTIDLGNGILTTSCY